VYAYCHCYRAVAASEIAAAPYISAPTHAVAAIAMKFRATERITPGLASLMKSYAPKIATDPQILGIPVLQRMSDKKI